VPSHESLALALALAASVCDVRTRRIPNALTFGAAAAALVVSTWEGGATGAATSGAGLLAGLALWFPLFALGGMGAGDVKLLAAIGAWLGPYATFFVSIYAGIAGALLALALVVARQCARQTFDNIYLLVTHWRVAGFAPHAQLTLETASSPRLAYAVPVLIGTLVVIWLQ
jgi:prepilin peptidase CpaA